MRIASILLVVAALAGPLRAHEGGHDVRGTVSAVGSGELTVKTSHGEQKFVLTPETEFVKDGSPASAEDLKPADRAVVHSKKRNGRFEAVKVQFRHGSAGSESAKTEKTTKTNPKSANPDPAKKR
jgi:Domain of unknown function (DUF5666)